MKRKRGCAKRKPKLAPVVGAKESTGNIVMLNTQDDLVPDDIDNTEFRSRMEFEKPQYGSKKSRKQASSQNQKVVDVNMEDNISSFPETSVAVSANVSRIARSVMSKSSRGFASSIREPCSIAEQVQGGGACQKEPNLPRQRRQYQDQELKAALEVIRKVMKMDAAEPFNVPVDPIALGIPDYFDIIDTPMDFGTICSNIENCAKYKNLTDVLRDVQYIWDNCCKYNKKGHYVLELMKRVKRNFNKLWGEAGLYMGAPETNGHSHLPATESNMRCNTERRGPLGSIADFARHQYQDQADPSRLQPPMSQCQSYQPQMRPCTYQQNSCQQQTSQQSARPNLGGAGHSHMTPIEGDVRQHPYGHRYSVDAMDDVCTRPLQKQTGQSQFQHQQHQPFFGHSQPYQPPQGFCQCHACSQQPQPSHQLAGTFTASAGMQYLEEGDFRASSSKDSMVKYSKSGNRWPVGPMTGYMSHQKQDQISPSHMQPHQPPSNHGQDRHHGQGTCQGKLSSSKLHPGCPPQRSQPRDFHSSPPEESMIRCSKRGPRCPVGPMTEYISHHQQDQVAASHMDPLQPLSDYGQEHPQQRTCRRKLSSSQLHDGFGTQQHSQPRKEMGGAGYSPPPAESMIRCTKGGPRDLVVSYQQQDQIYPSQIQPHQPQQRTGQGLQSSTQPEPSHSQADVDTGTADSSSTRRRKTRGRGPTRCLDVWNMIGKIPIVTNEFGQPIGVEAPKLVNFLGTIARNGHMAPLNYVDWRALPDENKEKMWQQVQSKFDIEPHSKSWVLKSIGNKWKNFKALLKSARYIPHKTNEGRLADRDERVLPDQWRILVSFWNSEEAKKRSIINKSCRANQKINHAAGSKSFARVREEQRAKRPDGKEPSRAELFIVTRTRKDGRPVNEASSAIISQLREQAIQRQGTSENGVVEDDVFHQVMGRDRHGRVRTYGLGPAPSDLEGPKPSHSEALKMVSEANTEVREMKERMVAMEQNCAQMAAQMATMMSMMSTMQNKSPDKHPHNVVDVSGKSEEAQQLQGPEMKSGRTTRSGKAASRKK